MAADLELGAEPIDTQAVTVPSEEKLIGLAVSLTNEQKWQQFPVTTTQRNCVISPGTAGQEKFAEYCTRWKAMIQTTEGQAVIQAAKAFLKTMPLALKTEVVDVAAEIE
jgi:hypothetical protein